MEATSNEEYEVQLYGFTPSDFKEGVHSLIDDHFEDTFNKLQKELSKIPKEVVPEEEIKEGIKTLRGNTRDAIEKTSTKLEEYLYTNIMKIPSHILLPEDLEQSTRYSSEDVSRLQEEIQEMKQQLKNEKYAEQKLKQELKDIKVVLKSQNGLLKSPFSTNVHGEIIKEKLNFLSSNNEETVAKLQHLNTEYSDLKFKDEFRHSFQESELQ